MKFARFSWITVVVMVAQFGIADAASVNWPQGLSKGTTVVLKVGYQGWTVDHPWSALGRSTDADKALDSLHAAQGLVFPPTDEFKAEKISDERDSTGRHYTQLEIRSSTMWLKLRFDPAKADAQANELLFVGTAEQFKKSKYFQDQVLAISAKTFTGRLADLPALTKVAFFELVGYKSSAISSETYKGQLYLSIGVDSGDVFNSIRLDQGAQVARTINDTLLSRLRTVTTLVGDGATDGIKLRATIRHRNFLEESALLTIDQLEVYVPLKRAKEFIAAEITSQQLIDASVVILNDNRIQAVLSSSAQ